MRVPTEFTWALLITVGVQPKIRLCVYRCKQPAQRGLSHCYLRGDCDGGSGEAEVVEPRSSKGAHSRKDGNPLGWLAYRRSAGRRGSIKRIRAFSVKGIVYFG